MLLRQASCSFLVISHHEVLVRIITTRVSVSVFLISFVLLANYLSKLNVEFDLSLEQLFRWKLATRALEARSSFSMPMSFNRKRILVFRAQLIRGNNTSLLIFPKRTDTFQFFVTAIDFVVRKRSYLWERFIVSYCLTR